jgi:hypothetical protein
MGLDVVMGLGRRAGVERRDGLDVAMGWTVVSANATVGLQETWRSRGIPQTNQSKRSLVVVAPVNM